MTSATGFSARWRDLAATRSPLCLGVAPSDKWLAKWSLPQGIDGARVYCDLVAAAADESLAAVKVQVPFFARFGGAGFDLLRRFTDRMHDRGTLVLLDAKLGDADDTMAAYAQCYLGPDSVLGGDAVTADCYLGFASLVPLFRAADAVGALVFVLVRTSNHAAEDVQHAQAGGVAVASRLADLVTEWNAEHGPVGAVVGARSPESGRLYERLPSALVEVPGLGRADRDTAEVLGAARVLEDRALFTVTTGVLGHGPDVRGLRESIVEWRGLLECR